jgi:hypothetical protein
MLNFQEFLKEENNLLIERALSQDLESDDKGKLHELLLAKHLHPDLKLPEHHRSESENEEHAGTPAQVHDRLMKKVGGAAYNEIESHAAATAQALKKHLEQQGHIGNGVHIGDVHWTSNADKPNKPGDHYKTVKDAEGNGVLDPNSNADLILTLKDKDGKTVGYHGVSAKYGANEPNYRNPGLESMEKTAGIPSGTLKSLTDTHHAHMEALGYNGSADQRNIQYKIDKMGIDKIRTEHAKLEELSKTRPLSKKNKIMHEHLSKFIEAHDGMKNDKQRNEFLQKAEMRAKGAEASSLVAKQTVAKKFAEGLAKKSDEELRDVVRNHVSAPTHIPHTVAHSKVKDNGTAESIVTPSHSIADEHLAKAKDLHVVHQGTTAVIKGTHVETGKPIRIATMTTKSSSGPHKSLVGTFSLK